MWVPRKVNMEFAKGKHFFIREEWPFPDKGVLINPHIYIY